MLCPARDDKRDAVKVVQAEESICKRCPPGRPTREEIPVVEESSLLGAKLSFPYGNQSTFDRLPYQSDKLPKSRSPERG